MALVGYAVISILFLVLVMQALDFSYYGNILGVLTIIATLIWMKRGTVRFKGELKGNPISRKSFWILAISQAVICATKNLIVPGVPSLLHRVAFFWRYGNRICYYVMLTVGTFYIVSFLFSLVQRRIALENRTQVKCADVVKSQEFLGIIGIWVVVLLLSFLRNRPVVFVNSIKAGLVFLFLVAFGLGYFHKFNSDVVTPAKDGAQGILKKIIDLLNKE